LRGYIVREHRRGRRLAEILDDPYIRRCGCQSLVWHVLEDPRMIDGRCRSRRRAQASAAMASAARP
jgi:hypothetical protein